MKGNVSKIVSDKGAASEQYIDATVGTALKNSKEAKEDASAARTIAQDAFYYSDEALGKITNAEVVAMQAQESAEFAKRAMEEHKSSPILDHPDGSVTVEKLSDEVKEHIEQAFRMAESATEKAYDAKDVAQSAKASASGAVQKAETVHGNLEEHINNSDVHTTAEEKADVDERIHTAQLTAEDAKDEAQNVYSLLLLVEDEFVKKLDTKADKPTITTSTDTALSFEFSTNHNTEIRTNEVTSLSFTFGNGEYAEDYASGLSFDSGATPTAIDYTDSGILNWVGTDCVTSDGLSIFQPSANTHYDIVFYFNGVQFIGLVNGFVPATGNEAV